MEVQIHSNLLGLFIYMCRATKSVFRWQLAHILAGDVKRLLKWFLDSYEGHVQLLKITRAYSDFIQGFAVEQNASKVSFPSFVIAM